MRDQAGRFAKGTSGNPGGRPKGRGLKQEIERTLAERPEGARETRLERIARMLVTKAEEGDLRALDLILKRLWPERLELQGDAVPTVIVRDYTGRSLTVRSELDERASARSEPLEGEPPCEKTGTIRLPRGTAWEHEREDPQSDEDGEPSAGRRTVEL